MTTLSLGFSPCPNDAFIFDAMIHNKIDLEGVQFNIYMEDVETLNQRAFRHELDVTKISYHALGHLIDQYVLLDAGSALGNNCGPLLIAKEKMSKTAVNQSTVAIPGKYTTANFLFSLAYPKAIHKKEMVFNQIEESVLNDTVKSGVIIHENRFTYQDKGLIKLIDLGEYWETKTGFPIPLGGIAAKRTLAIETIHKINRIMRRSVEYAFAHPDASKAFVKEHAQEMNDAVIQQHINLYVNKYTIDLGEKGRAAVSHLMQTAIKKRIISSPTSTIFIN